jgi:V8-like Glu-specific endopeptidase
VSRRLTAILAAALLLVVFAVPAQAAGERSPHERTVAYWTTARMASAIPRDFVHDPARGFAQAPAAKPDNPGKPGGGGGGGGGGGDTVTGRSWTAGGPIADITGKVFFTMGATRYVCSGAVARDSRGGYSLVLTAGHCAFDETSGAFATNWMFYPNYDASPTSECDDALYGCWTAQALVVHRDYTTAGGFNTQATLHDWAFAVVGPGGHGDSQLDELGFLPLTFSAWDDGTRTHAFGYPAAQKYKGSDLVYCAGPTFSDPYNDELTYGLTCDMTGGSSGGPWVYGMDGGDQALMSVNSYGYSGVKAMHGPKFNDETADTYAAANGATGNTVAGP